MRSQLRILAAAVVLATAGGLTGCTSGSDLSSVPVATAAPTTGASLDATEFAAAIQLPNTIIFDVRTPEEFASGHLPDAINLNVESPDFAAALATFNADVPYAVYCRSGNRSQTAMQIMEQAGFTEVYDLAGGIGAWTSAGGEVITD